MDLCEEGRPGTFRVVATALMPRSSGHSCVSTALPPHTAPESARNGDQAHRAAAPRQGAIHAFPCS